MLTLDYLLTPRTALSASRTARFVPRTGASNDAAPLADIAFGVPALLADANGQEIRSGGSAANGQLAGSAWQGTETSPADTAGATEFHIATPLLAPGGERLLERWTTVGRVAAHCLGAVAYRHDDDLLFGCIQLAETAAADLEANTAAAYRNIFEVLAASGFPHLWRVWNFIPRINAEAGGLERYRRFNVARQEAFAAAGRSAIDTVPAASAVGCTGPDLSIHFLAGRNAPLPIENPRQISAYDYPPEYGPRSPLFARACVAPHGDGEMLFISGTASIVGHRTLHAGDVRAQTRESLANIDAVLAAANARARPDTFSRPVAKQKRFERADLAYKVYVREPSDLSAIRDELQRWLPGAAAVYLQADICRADLLVEIEASGGHGLAELPA